MNRLKYILILLVILILKSKITNIDLIRNDGEEGTEVVSFVLTEHNPQCWYKIHGFSFTLSDCQRYVIGSKITLFGRADDHSANGFFQQKRLVVQEVKQSSLKPISGGFWFFQFWKFAQFWKTRSVSVLEEGLAEPSAGFIVGIIFGGSSRLSVATQEAFQVTGLTHVLSASGYNVAVVTGLVLGISRRLFPRVVSVLFSLITIWLYSLMAGAGPPILRAAMMLSLNLIGTQIFFRQYHLIWSLGLTAVLMMLIAPWYGHSLSFWLSMLATLGIAVFLPMMTASQGKIWQWQTSQFSSSKETVSQSNHQLLQTASGTEYKQDKGLMWQSIITEMKDSFRVTVAAQLLTAPLLIGTFGEISILSLISNPLLLWLTPILTVSGLIYVIFGVFFSEIPVFSLIWRYGQPLATTIIWIPAHLFLGVVSWLGQFQWGLIQWR